MLIKETKEMTAAEARAVRNTNASYLQSIALPIGTILDFAGITVPDIALLCDGRAVSRTEYAALFEVIGTAFGAGDGDTTFNLPNLCGRVTVSADEADADLDEIGKTGGEKEHAVTVDELPKHKLSGKTGNGQQKEMQLIWGAGSDHRANHITGFNSSPGYKLITDGSWPDAAHYHEFTTNEIGGDKAHNNMQPYLVVKKIIIAF